MKPSKSQCNCPISAFPFLQVNTNGVLSFNQLFRQPNPQPLPFKSLPFISPYWEHFGTARFGSIYYRNTTKPALLKRALYQLQDVFPSAKNYFPSYLFIATWVNVPQFGTLSAGQSKLVSFSLMYHTCLRTTLEFMTYLFGSA